MPLVKNILYHVLTRYAKKIANARSIIIVFFLISKLVLSAQTTTSREYQLKAAFLFNFTQFVEWPGNSFSSDQAPMVIGILGKDPFGHYLEEIVAGEKINGRLLQVEHYDTIEEVRACQVLFINFPDSKKTAQAISELQGRTILTVSDAPDFMQRGGMIRFFTKKDKINLQVNLAATKTADLVISSKLLRLVEIFAQKKG